MTLSAPRRQAQTYIRDGQERYVDTDLIVGDPLGTHVVIRVIDDPEAWARAIEAEGDAELTRWPWNNEDIAKRRRDARYRNAARIRAAGPRRSWYAHYHSVGDAQAAAQRLRARPKPGVRHEVAEIANAAICPHCQRPVIQADGTWGHHTAAGYPAGCVSPLKQEPVSTPDSAADEGFEINCRMGSMTCGYCGRTEAWTATLRGHALLTGCYLLGAYKGTGAVWVLAEAKMPDGQIVVLPHNCDMIPDHVRDAYARQIQAARNKRA
jgi:hypothetical protein